MARLGDQLKPVTSSLNQLKPAKQLRLVLVFLFVSLFVFRHALALVVFEGKSLKRRVMDVRTVKQRKKMYKFFNDMVISLRQSMNHSFK